ncbi:MAG: hypothetical protein AB7T06_39520 [Kofleriaceae bacterium]
MSFRVSTLLTARDASRLCAAIDRQLGYPRTHADDEPGVQRGRGAAPIYTETYTRPLRHSDGRVAVEVGPEVARFQGVAVDIDDGGPVRVTIDVRSTDATLPGGRDAWAEQPPRVASRARSR